MVPKSKTYRLDGQVCIKVGDFDILFIIKMIDKTKFILNLKSGTVGHLVEKKSVDSTKMDKREGGQH